MTAVRRITAACAVFVLLCALATALTPAQQAKNAQVQGGGQGQVKQAPVKSQQAVQAQGQLKTTTAAAKPQTAVQQQKPAVQQQQKPAVQQQQKPAVQQQQKPAVQQQQKPAVQQQQKPPQQTAQAPNKQQQQQQRPPQQRPTQNQQKPQQNLQRPGSQTQAAPQAAPQASPQAPTQSAIPQQSVGAAPQTQQAAPQQSPTAAPQSQVQTPPVATQSAPAAQQQQQQPQLGPGSESLSASVQSAVSSLTQTPPAQQGQQGSTDSALSQFPFLSSQSQAPSSPVIGSSISQVSQTAAAGSQAPIGSSQTVAQSENSESSSTTSAPTPVQSQSSFKGTKCLGMLCEHANGVCCPGARFCCPGGYECVGCSSATTHPCCRKLSAQAAAAQATAIAQQRAKEKEEEDKARAAAQHVVSNCKKYCRAQASLAPSDGCCNNQQAQAQHQKVAAPVGPINSFNNGLAPNGGNMGVVDDYEEEPVPNVVVSPVVMMRDATGLHKIHSDFKIMPSDNSHAFVPSPNQKQQSAQSQSSDGVPAGTKTEGVAMVGSDGAPAAPAATTQQAAVSGSSSPRPVPPVNEPVPQSTVDAGQSPQAGKKRN